MNRIVTIGWMGYKKCYLNLTKDEAIERFKKDEDLKNAEFEDHEFTVNEIEFEDEFRAYKIWSKEDDAHSLYEKVKERKD